MRVVARQSRRTATGSGLAAGSARPELCRERRSHACGRLLALLLGVPGLFTSAPGLVVATPALLLGAFGLPTPVQAHSGKDEFGRLIKGQHDLPVPADLTVTSTSSGSTASITATWNSATGANCYGISYRNIAYQGFYATVNECGTSHTFSNLDYGTHTYAVTVRSQDDGGYKTIGVDTFYSAGPHSLWSQEVTVTVTRQKPDWIRSAGPEPDVTPVITNETDVIGQPTSLTVTPGDETLALTWTAALRYRVGTDSRGNTVGIAGSQAAVTGYDVHYTSSSTVDIEAAAGSDATTEWVAVMRSGATPSQTIQALSNGTTYRVRVRATHAGASSSWDAASGIPNLPPQVSSAPIGSGATAGIPSGPPPSGSQPSGSAPIGSIPRPNNNNNNNGQNPVDKNGVPLPVPQSDLRPTFGDITVEDQSYTQGMQIEPLTLPAGTGGNDPLTYALTPALPAGLMLDMATRRLSGTPSMPQEARQYTWTATDADGDVMTLEFSIAVAAAPEPSFGDITVGDQSYTQGMQIAPLTLPEGTGGNGPLTYALTPALPDGLMLDMSTRYLSGTPSMPQAARQYTWTATDADGDTTTLEFSIAVAAAPEPKKVAAQEWPIRFGRTVSQQVTDALQSRFTAGPQPGLHLTVAGEELTSAVPLAENQSALAKLLGFETLTSHQLVQDSSFSFSPSVSAPHLSFWGEGTLSSFSGKAATVSLDSDVTTALLGAEWNAERWQAGAALSHSWGNGSYEAENGMEGEITTTMTGLYPYGRYALSPRLGIWASAGYGWGTLSLTSEGTTYNPSANMTMAAAGMDGLLLDGGAEGLSLSTIADVMTVKTTTDAVDGLAGSEGNVSRFRLGLEAVRPFPLSNGASLLPSLSVGVRQDSGDAETGFGTELGAGVSWMDPQRGISADLKGRILLTHGAEDFQERGMALSFAWDPNPSDRGPSLSVSHALGAAATGGLDALLNPTTMEGLGADPGSSEHQQFATRLAYGFPAFGDRLTVTPSLGLALSPYSSSTSLRWALTPYAGTGQVDEPWTISLEGQRQEDTTGSAPVDHSLELRFISVF